MIGGGTYFWLGYLTFFVCNHLLGWKWWAAKMMGDLLGWTANYVIQRYWAFANQGLALHEMRYAGRYVLITLIDFALDYAIVGGLKHIGITPYVGFFIASAFFTGWNYVWYRFWVFPEDGATITKHERKANVNSTNQETTRTT